MRLTISTTETLTDLKTDLVVANNNSIPPVLLDQINGIYTYTAIEMHEVETDIHHLKPMTYGTSLFYMEGNHPRVSL